MKSVLHIITGLENGGAEAVLFRLVTNDPQNKHAVVSLIDMGKYGPILQEHGIAVHCINMPKGRITFNGLSFLWKLIRKERPDILQTWMYHADLVGGLAGRFAGIKNIYWCIHNSNLLPELISRKTWMITRICAKLSYSVPRKIISCAQKAKDVHVAAGYCAPKFTLVPNGYDLGKFQPDPEAGLQQRTSWEIDKSVFLLGMVARFDPQKDIPNLLKAIQILSKTSLQFKVVMIGQGMEGQNTELHNWIEEQGVLDKIILLGQHDNIPAVMNAIDLLVLSSNGEAFPNVLSEAMACGTPCVSTNVGDASVIVGNAGWIVPPSSPDLLAQGIINASLAWADAENWHQLQQKARKHIEQNFGIDKMVSGYRKVWEIE